MQFEKLSGGGKKPPLTFPDKPVIPTKPAVFDDTEHVHRACIDCHWFYSSGYASKRCSNPAYKVWDDIYGWTDAHLPEARISTSQCGPTGKGRTEPVPPRDYTWLFLLALGAFAVAACLFNR